MINSLYSVFKDWSSGGGVYIIADPHFGDIDMNWRWDLIKDYPFVVLDILPNEEEISHRIAEYIIYQINKICTKNDTLIMLGDIGNPWYVKQLKAGYKVLIKGNHDKGDSTYSNLNLFLNEPLLSVNNNLHNNCVVLPMILESAQEKQDILQQDIFIYPPIYSMEKLYKVARKYYGNSCQVDHLAHVPEEVALESYHIDKDTYDKTVFAVCSFRALFDEIYDGPLMISDKLMLSHEPVQGPWMNLHGHVHSDGKSEVVYKEIPSGELTARYTAGFYNLCAEKLNFTPINLGEFIRQGNMTNIKNIHRVTIDKASNK